MKRYYSILFVSVDYYLKN